MEQISKKICENRKKALERIMTPQNTAAAKIEIESIILPRLEKQSCWNSTSTVFSVTYYSVNGASGEQTWVTHDLDFHISNGDSRPVKRDVLSVAVELARTYDINAEEVYENGYWIFQFTYR